jgi:alkanesulfonate monooxygenase SsuD/methylene tetrahydromethanopterin reductase-like flavin-dependent oxidoreductase (luciferase family)
MRAAGGRSDFLLSGRADERTIPGFNSGGLKSMRLGYLLPTREQIMEGRPDAAPLLALAERAAGLGFDSIWAGDSLLARPRHEPLTLLAAVAGRVPGVEVGTAVLLPALRNPVLLAHQVATLDQVAGGRLILGVGIARDVPSIRAEFTAAGVPFEKRVGRMNEGLRLARALWSGKPVDWDGLWRVEKGTLAPTPASPGGPRIWLAGSLPASLERAATLYDGWMPNAGDAAQWRQQWVEIQRIAREAGRDPAKLTGSMYLTLSIDDDVARANERLDRYMERYYDAPAVALRKRQECFAGPPSAVAAYLTGYLQAGARHLILRFAGDHERHLETVAALRTSLEV